VASWLASATFDPEAIERLNPTMRDNIQSGDAPCRKAYIRAVTTSSALSETKVIWNKQLPAVSWPQAVFADVHLSGAPEEIRTPDP
jgi:hypothetical protein